jgi:glycerol uptake facilitator protein
VFFGVGSVFVAVLTGALQGLFQVAIVWGIAIAICIYATGAISGAHFNPAVTLACAVWRGFPLIRVLPYITAQLLGAFAVAEHVKVTHLGAGCARKSDPPWTTVFRR